MLERFFCAGPGVLIGYRARPCNNSNGMSGNWWHVGELAEAGIAPMQRKVFVNWRETEPHL